MKKLTLTTVLSSVAILLAGAPSQAATLVTGGVGEFSENYVEKVQENYNLKMTFTGEGGMYLSDVDVRVEDMNGNEVVSGTAEGPIMLGQLEPGKYKVSATKDGTTKTQTVYINSSLKSYTLRFPITDEFVQQMSAAE